jgi:hypothetical protein
VQLEDERTVYKKTVQLKQVHDPIKDNTMFARHQWHMPVVLGTWEAEIRRITVPGQPWQIV